MPDEAEFRATTLVARSDEVIGVEGGEIEDALQEETGMISGWIDVPGGTYALVEDGATPTTPPRWRVSVESGVLLAAAWKDSQDRDLENPGTVLMLAPGSWTKFRSEISYPARESDS